MREMLLFNLVFFLPLQSVPADADDEERQLHEAIRLSLLEASAASTYNARLPSGTHVDYLC